MTFKREKRHDESCRFPKTYYTVLLEHTLGWVILLYPKVAHVVKEIFDLALKGNGVAKICRHLNKQHILRPAAYAAERGETGFERHFEGNEDKRYSHIFSVIFSRSSWGVKVSFIGNFLLCILLFPSFLVFTAHPGFAAAAAAIIPDP